MTVSQPRLLTAAIATTVFVLISPALSLAQEVRLPPDTELALEEMLRQRRGALLVVSHDRAFLRNLGTGIIWLHDSKLRRRDGHFDEFEAWSDNILADLSLIHI